MSMAKHWRNQGISMDGLAAIHTMGRHCKNKSMGNNSNAEDVT